MRAFAALVSSGSPKARRVRLTLWASQLTAAAILIAALLTPSWLSPWLIVAAALLIVIQFAMSLRLGFRALEQIAAHSSLLESAQHGQRQVEELFAMTDMLQSADGHTDAGAVLRATSQRLLPQESGALYVFNNSRDRLDLVLSWAPEGEYAAAETIVPESCWALKRGKLHVNDPSSGTLCCTHHEGLQSTLEIPMTARGTVYGLLMLAPNDVETRALTVKQAARIGRALADTMSLALSNIALREKLRTQSLRDPLTGLYNRRYMEDALERYLSMAERSADSTSVIMIDLDNFKALNDTHGHAKGDAVLRDVAAQLVGALRPADVVCRYGGEELLVILPACPLEDAVLKAEVLRGRVESLSGVHGMSISASFGVASVPETSSGGDDVIPMADSALYAAKKAGRNCVRTVETRAPRAGGESPISRLVIA